MSSRIVLAVLVLAVATGCAGREAGQGADLRGNVYVSTSVSEQGKPRALVEGTKVELRFTDDGRLLANAGCNQMQGPVQLGDGKLAVAEISTTAMGCPKPELHEQDDWLSKLLDARPSWRLDGANLVLTGSNAEIVLAREQPAALEGAWTVDGLISKDAVSSLPEGVQATVSFKDGHVYTAAGCNSGSTDHSGGERYEVDGRTITFGDLVTTMMMCSQDQMAVESVVLDTLGLGEVTYEIDRDTLTLKNADGVGLQLRK